MFGILVIVLLVWAAVAGVLWGVLKIAAGVALGLFFAGLLFALAGYWFVRRALTRARGTRRTPIGPESEGDARPY